MGSADGVGGPPMGCAEPPVSRASSRRTRPWDWRSHPSPCRPSLPLPVTFLLVFGHLPSVSFVGFAWRVAVCPCPKAHNVWPSSTLVWSNPHARAQRRRCGRRAHACARASAATAHGVSQSVGSPQPLGRLRQCRWAALPMPSAAPPTPWPPPPGRPIGPPSRGPPRWEEWPGSQKGGGRPACGRIAWSQALPSLPLGWVDVGSF